MGMTGNTSPFGQPFSQTGGQQMGATGVNPQLSSKQNMVNSLPAFPTDIKNTSVTNVPNMVSCPWFFVLRVLVGTLAYEFCGAYIEKL